MWPGAEEPLKRVHIDALIIRRQAVHSQVVALEDASRCGAQSGTGNDAFIDIFSPTAMMPCVAVFSLPIVMARQYCLVTRQSSSTPISS